MELPLLATIRSFRVGVARRWKRGGTTALAYVGALWLLAEISMAAFPQLGTYIEAHQTAYLLIMGALAAWGFLSQTFEPRAVDFVIPTTDTTLSVTFGDLFSRRDEDLLINANVFFDSQLGQVVDQGSVYGGFISTFFGGDAARLRQELDSALAGHQGTPTQRAIDPKMHYPVGTTVALPIGPSRAYVFAFAETDLTAAAKASSTVPDLWSALTQALRFATQTGNGRALAIPLVGNGRSGLNLKPQDILRLIVLCIIVSSRTNALPKRVTIVVPDACFDKLDLVEIKRDWR